MLRIFAQIVPTVVAIVLVLYFIATLVVYSFDAFITGRVFTYEATLPSIYGSVLVSTIAVLIALVFSISLAVWINEVLPRAAGHVVSALVDTMAAFPTVIFGIWGLTVFAPYFRDYIEYPLWKYLGFLPMFSYMPTQPQSLLLAGTVLGIMVTPFATAIIRETYRTVPVEVRETILALGGGKWEIVKIHLLYIRDAIIGGLTLSFGKAIGETAAVALLIGGRAWFCPLTAPCEAIPSLIASKLESAIAENPELMSVFAALALILFAIGAAVLTVAKYLVRRWYR